MQANYSVGFSADATNQALKVEDDRVTFDVNGHTYATTLATGNEIGNVAGRNGRLTITNGAWALSPFGALVDIGAVANASGFLTVSTGGQITGLPELIVGALGTGALTVNSGGTIDAGSTILGNAAGTTGTATITGAASTLNAGGLLNAGGVIIGSGSQASGTLNIAAGGTVHGSSDSVGFASGATGDVTVSGADSQWINSRLSVGRSGDGTLNVTAGGRVESFNGILGEFTGSMGTVTVDGANSQWINSRDLVVGRSGDGTLHITAGGRVENSIGGDGVRAGTIGSLPGATGAVTVSGASSQWIISGPTSQLRVGEFGNGELTITDGGQVQSTFGVVGFSATLGPVPSTAVGVVTVDGATSRWINIHDLAVGHGGQGTLNITGGGRVQCRDGHVGFIVFGAGDVFVVGAGVVTVTGPDSQWINSADLSVGDFGQGTLNIAAGGFVQSTVGFVGKNAGSTGVVTIDGAGTQWSNSGNLNVGSGGNGALTLSNSGTVEAVNLIVGALGEVRGDGTIIAHIQNGGLVAPGSSPGTLQIVGNYEQQAAGTMEFEIGGLTQGTQYDFLQVGGNALLDGQLQLKLAGGFIPNDSQTFVVFSCNILTGVFDNAGNGQRVAALDGSGSFLVHYGPGSLFAQNQIVLSSFQLGADFDEDGDVDGDDLTRWNTGFGVTGTATHTQGDADGDQDVDGADFLAWQRQLGSSSPMAAATGIPNRRRCVC